jgi:hypothetical protein
MADGFDPLAQVFHLSDQERKAVDVAEGIVGGLSGVWGQVNTVKSVLEGLGVLDRGDPIGELRRQIDQLWEEFQGVVAALDQHSSMRDVANQLALARGALRELTESAPEDAATPGVDVTWDALRPLVLDHTLLAVITLGEPAYWERVFVPELLYKSWPRNDEYEIYFLNPTPVVTNGLVFDYRLAMPAFVEAIAARLTVLAAAMPNYERVAQDELKSIADTLESYRIRVRASISSMPKTPDFVFDDEPGGASKFFGVNSWIAVGAVVGAVEYYSGFDSVMRWPQDEYPLGPHGLKGLDRSDPIVWERFLVRYTVRTWVRTKQVYAGVGLVGVERIIIHLKELAGIESATIEGWGGDFSIRELASTLYAASGSGWGYFPILQDENGKLPNPLSLRRIMDVLQTYELEPYGSVRAALAQ